MSSTGATCELAFDWVCQVQSWMVVLLPLVLWGHWGWGSISVGHHYRLSSDWIWQIPKQQNMHVHYVLAQPTCCFHKAKSDLSWQFLQSNSNNNLLEEGHYFAQQKWVLKVNYALLIQQNRSRETFFFFLLCPAEVLMFLKKYGLQLKIELISEFSSSG